MGAGNKDAYAAWIKEIASHIKTLDTNHLVSTGSEGQAGSEEDFDLYAEFIRIPILITLPCTFGQKLELDRYCKYCRNTSSRLSGTLERIWTNILLWPIP